MGKEIYEFKERPVLSAQQRQSPFSKFYYDDIPKPAGNILKAIGDKQMPPEKALDFKDIEKVFLPNGACSEYNGWCILPDGTGFSTVLTNMPGVTPEMESWWDMFMMDPNYDWLNYRIWMPGLHESHGMPAVEDLGWGMSEIYFACPIFPEEMGLSDAPEKLDKNFIKCLAISGYSKLKDVPDAQPEYLALISCVKKSEDGIQVHTLGYMGMKWENGALVKVHDAIAEKMQLSVTHNAYEFARKAKLLPGLYSYAITLENRGLNPDVRPVGPGPKGSK